MKKISAVTAILILCVSLALIKFSAPCEAAKLKSDAI